ncbi:MAG: hypothetical protein QNL91_02060 [Candidatus Krumholzibacteria bacterium]|nr:hypothetical protein [Candidatus Krumholzibacteria bacterium]
MSLFDDVKGNLVEWYTATSEKTTEVTRVATRKYDKFGISRDIERQFSELGSLIYTGLQDDRTDLLEDEGVLALVERIAVLETELRGKDEEIDSIRQEYAGRKAEAAAAGGMSSTVITDPILDEGREESAILVEPNMAESPAETGDAENAESVDPEKDG